MKKMKNNNLRILFRTSGGRAKGKQLGFGHINRCINLASEFEKSKVFFLIEDFGKAEEFILKHGFKNIITLKNNISIKNDINETIHQILENKIKVIVIDKYDTNKKKITELKKIVKTVMISDLKKINYPADLVINGFIGFNDSISKNSIGNRCLLGPKYQILNSAFRNNKLHYKKKYDLLVTFGGFDEKNILKIFLKNLIFTSSNIKIKIILGPATIYSTEIKNIIKKIKNNITIVQSVKNMQKEISSSRYGLCSGGITSYEFASLKIPFAIICQVPHQITTAREWERIHVGKNLGLKNHQTAKKIELFLNHINSNEFFFKQQYKKIDGYGSKRIAKEIINLVNN